MSLLSVPLKTILDWHADIQNDTPPTDYAICDGRTLNSSQQDINPGGSYTVPDLRNVFLLGADITKTAGTAGASVGSGSESLAAGAPGPKGTGGENSHILATSELASHTHTFSGTTGNDSPDHTHVTSVGNTAGTGVSGPGGGIHGDSAFGWTSGGASVRHTHSFSGTTASNGSGNAHENRGKYYGVVKIMKVKI